MDIFIHDKQKTFFLNRPEIKKIIHLVLKEEKISCDILSVSFVTKKEIIRLHKDFFNDPTPTDCISFPIDLPNKQTSKPRFLGEIFICPQVAKEYAKQYHVDVKEELYLYLIHGLLHLIGYNDKSSKERSFMRKKEKKCMNLIKDQKII